jgi:hypothetical protein
MFNLFKKDKYTVETKAQLPKTKEEIFNEVHDKAYKEFLVQEVLDDLYKAYYGKEEYEETEQLKEFVSALDEYPITYPAMKLIQENFPNALYCFKHSGDCDGTHFIYYENKIIPAFPKLAEKLVERDLL